MLLTGKWHLGEHKDRLGDNAHHPLSQGFDYFYGTIGTNLADFGEDKTVILSLRPYWYGELFSTWCVTAIALWCLLQQNYLSSATFVVIITLWSVPVFTLYFVFDNMTLLASFVHRNYDLVEQPLRLEGMSQRLVHEGLEFLRNTTQAGQPFLIVMSWIHMHVAIKTVKQFEGRSGIGEYGDGLLELDWSVGEILKGLTETGVDDNTLVYFSSDNGGHVEIGKKGGNNGQLKGKTFTYTPTFIKGTK